MLFVQLAQKSQDLKKAGLTLVKALPRSYSGLPSQPGVWLRHGVLARQAWVLDLIPGTKLSQTKPKHLP